MTQKNHAESARARKQFLIVVGIFALPLLLAIGLYFGGWRPATVNTGKLVNPARPIASVALLDPDSGASVALRSLYGKWLLVYLASDSCGAGCINALYKMRAAALFQGEHSVRVRRLLIFLRTPALARVRGLKEQFPGLHVLVAPTAVAPALSGSFQAGTPLIPQAGTIEMLDPLGNWMMIYPPDADARGMRKDLTRLLAVSQIG